MDALDVGSSNNKIRRFSIMKLENWGYSKKTTIRLRNRNPDKNILLVVNVLWSSFLNNLAYPDSQIRRMCKNQLYFDINVVYVIEKRSSLSAANRATRSKWDVCKIDFRLSNTYPNFLILPKLLIL